MIILFVKFRSGLPPEQVHAIMNERADQFRAFPELHQKYYARDKNTDEWCGVYLWDSPAALESFRTSDLARSIPAAYQVIDTPRMEVLDVLFALRPEAEQL